MTACAAIRARALPQEEHPDRFIAEVASFLEEAGVVPGPEGDGSEAGPS